MSTLNVEFLKQENSSSNNVTLDSDGSVAINRHTSDGTIIDLQKDGTSVGSIQSRAGVASSFIGYPASGQGSGITGGDNRILSIDETNTPQDGTITLGASTLRWKDLYLSGGVYVGGTGAANYLDDYEEGTWTPSIVASVSESGQNYIRQQGTYTKIGNRCYCSFSLILSTEGTFSGTYLLLSGLPFNIPSSGHDTVMGGSLYFVNLGVNVYMVGLQLREGDNKAYLWAKLSHSASREYLSNTDLTNNTELSGQFFYPVA